MQNLSNSDSNEALQQYGQEAQILFEELAQSIRREFNDTLRQLLTQELPAFQEQVQQTLNSSGLSSIGNLLGDGIAHTLGVILPGSVFDNVLNTALNGAFRQSVNNLVKNGKLDAESIWKAADSAGANSILRLSRSQQSAEAMNLLSKGQRNL